MLNGIAQPPGEMSGTSPRLPLRRSQTDGVISISGSKSKENGSLSHSYDDRYSNDAHVRRVSRSKSLHTQSTNRSLPHLSYREAVTTICESNCTCDCHNLATDQSYLTLCRCHMSGYESYRKAVYGGAKGTKKSHSMPRSNQSNRKSNPDPRMFFGSAETLESSHSADTIKAYTDGVISSDKSTGSSNRSHKSTSPNTLHDNRPFRDREMTVTHESVPNLTVPQEPFPSLPIKRSNLRLWIPVPNDRRQVGISLERCHI